MCCQNSAHRSCLNKNKEYLFGDEIDDEHYHCEACFINQAVCSDCDISEFESSSSNSFLCCSCDDYF